VRFDHATLVKCFICAEGEHVVTLWHNTYATRARHGQVVRTHYANWLRCTCAACRRPSMDTLRARAHSVNMSSRWTVDDSL
jgi:hypothetical protein